ncbi:MAG TPA: DUF3540 domain-containing protein [Paucimonas sp.]|nr:DUF3540 domain-containing protein [Paucimonas sp.]
MHIVKDPTKTPVPAEPFWAETQVAVELDAGQYLLDDGRLAVQATSCVIRPAAGDRVLVAGCKEGENYIVHLLHRSRDTEACLSVPGMDRLAIRQPNIDLNASGQIAVRSLRDIEVTAATGVLTLNARNLFSTVSESLVENVRNYVGNVGQYLLEVKQLLRLHGRHASITAEQDVKVDADRISMG